MKRKTRSVTSREYKVMLQAQQFTGGRKSVLRAAEQLRSDFAKAIKGFVRRADGEVLSGGTFRAAQSGKQVSVTFFDTADLRLRRADFIFRERQPDRGKRKELTLKRRHPDRFLASDSRTGGESKFEEDIKTTQTRDFLALYSLSGKVQDVKAGVRFRTLGDIQQYYKPLKKQLGAAFQPSVRLHRVGGFTARQTVLEGPTFRTGDKTTAQCALIVWHRAVETPRMPVVVEFSFRYDDEALGSDTEPFTARIAQCCFEVLQTFRHTGKKAPLAKWVDLNGPTKTAYVYGLESE